MEHKFIIEVILKYEGPKEEPQDPAKPKAIVNIDPKVLNSLLAQLPHAIAALQPQGKTKGQPPIVGHPPMVN